jgi:hypothetical protein
VPRTSGARPVCQPTSPALGYGRQPPGPHSLCRAGSCGFGSRESQRPGHGRPRRPGMAPAKQKGAGCRVAASIPRTGEAMRASEVRRGDPRSRTDSGAQPVLASSLRGWSVQYGKAAAVSRRCRTRASIAGSRCRAGSERVCGRRRRHRPTRWRPQPAVASTWAPVRFHSTPSAWIHR